MVTPKLYCHHSDIHLITNEALNPPIIIKQIPKSFIEEITYSGSKHNIGSDHLTEYISDMMVSLFQNTGCMNKQIYLNHP